MTERVIFVNYLFFNRIGALYLKTFKTQFAAFPAQVCELVREHYGEYRLSRGDIQRGKLTKLRKSRHSALSLVETLCTLIGQFILKKS